MKSSHEITLPAAALTLLLSFAAIDWVNADDARTLAPNDENSMSAEDRAWYDSRARVRMFQTHLKRMDWPALSKTLGEEYLAACGGTPNALGAILVRDLGSRPMQFTRPEKVDASAGEATMETEADLRDGSRVLLSYRVEKLEEGRHGWDITQVELTHRDDRWTLCRESPAFAEEGADGP